jgi:hypothetical protein
MKWEAAMSEYVHAVTHFVVHARHDIGMLDDNRGKTRDAIEKALVLNRKEQLTRELQRDRL